MLKRSVLRKISAYKMTSGYPSCPSFRFLLIQDSRWILCKWGTVRENGVFYKLGQPRGSINGFPISLYPVYRNLFQWNSRIPRIWWSSSPPPAWKLDFVDEKDNANWEFHWLELTQKRISLVFWYHILMKNTILILQYDIYSWVKHSVFFTGDAEVAWHTDWEGPTACPSYDCQTTGI